METLKRKVAKYEGSYVYGFESSACDKKLANSVILAAQKQLLGLTCKLAPTFSQLELGLGSEKSGVQKVIEFPSKKNDFKHLF